MITNDILLSHLSCKRKAHLKAAGLSGERSDFEAVQLGLDRGYRQQALTALQGEPPAVARIVHGAGHKVLRVKLEPLLGEVRKLLGEIRAVGAEPNPPKVTLNGHCNACEFRTACRRVAEEADDLSLLRG